VVTGGINFLKSIMKHLLLLLFAITISTLSAQSTCVTGTVVSDDGSPLISCTVISKDGRNGVVTDFDGHFSLCNLPEDSEVILTFNYIGYESVTDTFNTKDNWVTVTMEGGVVMEEVVVMAYHVPLIQTDMTQALSSASISNLKSSGRKRKAKRQPRQPDPIRPSAYNKLVPNAFLTTREAPISTISTDVDRAAYANIRGFLNRGQLPPAEAVRIEEMINYFPYTKSAFGQQDLVGLNTEIIGCPWRAEARLLRVTAQATDFAPASAPKNNLVFLIDVSGSMGSSDKLPLLKESLRRMSRQLGPEDNVSIVVYAGAAGMVLPPTAGNDTIAIFGALEKLKSGGSTAGGAGIELAYKTAAEQFIKGGNNRVIIASDGDFNVGISDQNQLIKLIEKKRETGIFLTVLGFGTGNYQEGMMQELADRGNGNHAYIDKVEEAEKVLVEEFNGTIQTMAKDVKLQIEFDPRYIDSYRLIGYENRLLNTEDFDDDKKDAAEMGAGHQVTVLYEIVPAKDYDEAVYVASLRMRYKPAAGGRSHKVMQPIAADALPDELASQNILWAAAVAEFGMLLRNSAHKGQSSWTQLLELAEANLGADPGGYRNEMIGLIRKAEGLASRR
jgi:Ca-activated chloride channel family protein